jgi:tetratricopeptide (TPR) repeat protein
MPIEETAPIVADGAPPRIDPRPVGERDTILVGDIENRTGNPVLDGTLKQALALHLSQSPYLELLSDRKVHAILSLMGHASAPPLLGDVALEICQRTGARAAITGSISVLADEYVIGLYAVHGETGDTLVPEQARARGLGEVLRALDGAALGLRAKLGESLASVRRHGLATDEVATGSLQALKQYALGRRANVERGDAAAIPHHQRAIEIDPQFASAYSALGLAYSNMGQAARGTEYMLKAYELRDRVTERERYRLTAYHSYLVTGDLHAALEAYRAWHENYPRDDSVKVNMTSLYSYLGQWDKALATGLQALGGENTAILYNNLVIVQQALNLDGDARATLERAREQGYDAYYLDLDAYYEAFLRGDSAAMARHVEAVMGRPGEEDFLIAAQADTEAYYGRMRSARSLARRAIESAHAADAPEAAAIWQAEAALREAEMGFPEAALDAALAALAASHGRPVTGMAGLALARAAEAPRANQLADALEREFPADTLVQRYWVPCIRGALALARGDAATCLQALEKAAAGELGQVPPFELGMLYPPYLRGAAFLRAGRAEDAAREYRKILARPGIAMNFITFPLAQLGLARALALGGEQAEAAVEYDRFLDVWRGADGEVAVLKEAIAERDRVR